MLSRVLVRHRSNVALTLFSGDVTGAVTGAQALRHAHFEALQLLQGVLEGDEHSAVGTTADIVETYMDATVIHATHRFGICGLIGPSARGVGQLPICAQLPEVLEVNRQRLLEPEGYEHAE